MFRPLHAGRPYFFLKKSIGFYVTTQIGLSQLTVRFCKLGKGKNTREGIYNLRTIIERYIKCGKNIYLSFIDYEKAFDRVKLEKIIECMENLDIDGKDISLGGAQ